MSLCKLGTNTSQNGVDYSYIVGSGAAAVATLMRTYLPESWLDQANDEGRSFANTIAHLANGDTVYTYVHFIPLETAIESNSGR